MAFETLRNQISTRLAGFAIEYLESKEDPELDLLFCLALNLDKFMNSKSALLGKLFLQIGESCAKKLQYDSSLKSFKAAYIVYKRCQNEGATELDLAIVLRQMSLLLRDLGQLRDSAQFDFRSQKLTKSLRKSLEKCYCITA